MSTQTQLLSIDEMAKLNFRPIKGHGVMFMDSDGNDIELVGINDPRFDNQIAEEATMCHWMDEDRIGYRLSRRAPKEVA